MVELLPLTISELKSHKLLKDNAYDQILHGFYPPFYDEEKYYEREDWFENYIDTYLEKDVAEQINVNNMLSFKKFIRICALYSGKMLNMESIAKAVEKSCLRLSHGFQF